MVSPSPHDGHPRHEAVGRAVAQTLRGWPQAVWWCYSVWGDLPLPTLYVGVTQDRLDAALHVLEAYAGELARNDYRKLVAGRAAANAVLGTERVFGFGAARADSRPYAELLTETAWDGTRFRAGTSRIHDPRHPLEKPSGADMTAWLTRPSDRNPEARPEPAI
ncbi:MAG: hypothetical protein LC779_09660 [Actinobacteria bacterium]|nr:hypothetical protein [Actinomycetota bacterium]